MKKIFKNLFVVFLATFTLQIFAMASGQPENIKTAQNFSNLKPVKYVFLFIGDGMSIPQRMAAEEFSIKNGNGKLFINSMPHQAVTKTSSANSFITDSAASGTAIACGEKTYNGAIGIASDRKRKLESIAEVAHKSGRKVGIITTVTINHATPASFYAHNTSRGNYYNIALDLINSNFEYFGGGGVAKYNDTKNKAYKGNIYELAQKAGYTVAQGKNAIKAIPANAKKVLAAGYAGQMPYAIDRTENDMALADFVADAIKRLDNEKGFFIMAEGGKIDYSGHGNDAGTNIIETIDFDNAVKIAYEFAKKHPSETLIVVTGDHETGGFTLGFAGTAYSSYIQNIKYQKCSQDVFYNKIAAFASKEKVAFDDIKSLITENFGLIFPENKADADKHMVLSKNEVDRLKNAFNIQFPNGKYKAGRILTAEVIKIFDNKCSLAWTTGAHTALPVLTTAWGKNSETFSGMIDNTDIAKFLKQAVR